MIEFINLYGHCIVQCKYKSLKLKKNLMKIIVFFWMFFLLSIKLIGQIPIVNKSFDGVLKDNSIPDGWQKCGSDSTPDLLPGPWTVFLNPKSGKSYLGLTVRSENTWEMLGQKLEKTIKKDDCYTFSVHLAYSKNYSHCNNPTKFRIWGANGCNKVQLLATSVTITHPDWRKYTFFFFAEKDFTHIILEPTYETPNAAYDGNILIDDISDFVPCPRA